MAEYNGTIDLISGIRPKNNGTFPLVDAKDVQMPDGTRLSEYEFSADVDVPEFDLVALGLPTVVVGEGAQTIETNTAEILEAVKNGQVKFKVSAQLGGGFSEMSLTALSGNAVTISDTGAGITALVNTSFGVLLIFTIDISETTISVYFDIFREIPDPTTADAGKVLSVSQGGSVFWKEIEIPEMPEIPEVDTSAPVFDLVSMGLPSIAYGTAAATQLETDTTEIMSALQKGVATFKVNVSAPVGSMSVDVPFEASFTPLYTLSLTNGQGQYICGTCLPIMTQLDCLIIIVQEGLITAAAYPIEVGGGSATPPAIINLSGLETNGQIIEMYADGSSKLTQIEFDTDGNPTKITDSDGNVTNLVW